MLTLLCPNCRHRFPAIGCCATGTSNVTATIASSNANSIEASATTSINFAHLDKVKENNALLLFDTTSAFTGNQQVTISTQCGIQSGGCLIENSSNVEKVLLAPRIEVRSTLSGGGCLVQKRPELAAEDSSCNSWGDQSMPLLISEEQLRKSFEQAAQFQKSHSRSATTTFQGTSPNRIETPFNGFQNQSVTTTAASAAVAPEVRERSFSNNIATTATTTTTTTSTTSEPKCKGCECRCCCYCRCCYKYSKGTDREEMQSSMTKSHCCNENSQCQASNDHRLARCCRNKETNEPSCNTETDKYSGDVRIQVNATVHLPSSTNSYTLNITTTTTTSPAEGLLDRALTRPRISLNGGGIINVNDINNSSMSFNSSTSSSDHQQQHQHQQQQQPSTPLSWLAPCPWGFVNVPTSSFLTEKDRVKLADIRKTLQNCGWYYEGLGWQESENLLKDAPIGRWLMRDSSDSRYVFAVSVQTAQGPTSVRVFYFKGKFRLDAEPKLASSMPLFDCPIRMLEYYVEYSKQIDENRREVWLDYSGLVYSQIYLSDPLVKEVRSLAHLARLAVNRAGLEKEWERLPPLIKNYLIEYPYSL